MNLPPVISSYELMKRRSGRQVDYEEWLSRQERESEWERQGNAIATKLVLAGVSPYQEVAPTYLVGLMTLECKRLNNLKNRNFFPTRQAHNTSAMRNLVEWWCSIVPKNQLKMMVFTYGWVKNRAYRTAHSKFRRWISKFFSKNWVKEAGLELNFIRIEGNQHRDRNNDACTHLHAHLIVRASRRLMKNQWDELIKRIRDHAPKKYFHSSRLRDPAECTKYCFKFDELEKDLSSTELAELWHQTEGLKFYQAVGELGELAWNLNQINQKIIKDDGRWFREQQKMKVQAKDEAKSLHDVLFTDVDPEAESDEPLAPKENLIVGFTNPLAIVSPVNQSYAIVRGFSGDPSDLIHQEAFQKRREKEVPFWDRNQGAVGAHYMQHTTTTTVFERITDVEVRPPP